MINPSSQINSIQGPGPSIKQNVGTEQQTGTGFADSASNAGKLLAKVDDLQEASEVSIKALLAGKNSDITQVVSSVATADMSFKLLVGVRNKLIEAYKQTLEENKIRVKKDENKNLKVMADVMGKMKPDNAADMLVNMVARPKGLEPNERLGVEEAALYIFFMNAKQQPKVFDAMIKDNNQATAATLMATVKLIELEQ